MIYISAPHYLYIAHTAHFALCILLSALCIHILHCFPQLWVYVYFPTLAPELVVAGPLMTPYSLVFEGQHRPRPRETLFYLRQYFDTVRTTEVFQNSQFFLFSSLICLVHSRFLIGLCIGYLQITWQPWAPLGGDTRFQFAGAWGASRYRILFEGPVGRA